MCQGCATGLHKLRRATGWSHADAMSFLWQLTPYPITSPLPRVEEFLRVKPKNRKRWLRRQDKKLERAMERISQEA